MKRCLNIPQTDDFLWNSIISILNQTVPIKEKLNEFLLSEGRLNKRQLNLYITKKNKELEKIRETKSKLEEGIIDVERKNYMGEFQSENIYLSLKKQLNKEHLSLSSKIESILSHLSTIGNESKWFEIIDGFKDIISNHDPITQSQKRDVLRSILDHVKVSFDGVNKTHQLDVNFRIPMVYVEQGSRVKPRTLRQSYSTVMECDPLTVLAKDTNLYFLTLGLEINVADLWVSHYSDHQQYLFETITKFRVEGWSYLKISQWFNDNNILTPRGKKFVPPSVHSIVKKKRISDERFGRTFPVVINEADINVQNTTPTDFK